jgi:hypothetical protein
MAEIMFRRAFIVDSSEWRSESKQGTNIPKKKFKNGKKKTHSK